LKIEDYALIGNSQSAALVGRDGSIDWLCLPRFDSPSCFAALLGDSGQGRWKIAPPGWSTKTRRRYRPGTLVLETEFSSPDGSAAAVLIDCMVPELREPVLIRIVRGLRGKMAFETELVIRFDYGSIIPWVRKMLNGEASGIVAIGGPDTLRLHTPCPLRGMDFQTYGRFEVCEGQEMPFVMSWHPSHEQPSREAEAVVQAPSATLERVSRHWLKWTSKSTYDGPHREAVERSLITLKALTHATTGGIVAAPTTSLPERIGGVRNWDYRLSWLRDATFTLDALASAGFHQEARAWRDWLLRAVAGRPSDLRIMYGLGGERRLTEMELPWLPGYEGSRPVRIGNAASVQLQLDVYGEVIDALHLSMTYDRHDHQRRGTRVSREADVHDWRMQKKLLGFLETIWEKPDSGIWEVRGPPRHFTHSKVMAWVALDRGIKSIEGLGFDGPLERWRELRGAIHAQVCERGFNRAKGSFTQYYGSDQLDASLLLIPLVGFLPASDPRMRATTEAIGRELKADGLILRYSTGRHHEGRTIDGLPPGEGAFLACSFWYVENLAALGRHEEAREIFEHLLSLRNDVGLLPEEYDPRARRFLGNYPQAFSHVALVNSACALWPRVRTGHADRQSA
jgi:GH15 family glucan-1,4-alpha-glucosidase